MPITQALNSKGNVKKFTANDLPFSPQQPVIASYYATSTASQTVINLPFSVVASGNGANTDIFWLFVDGKKLDLGSSNDYTFTAIGSDNTSSQVTLTFSLSSGLNIQAFKLGLKKESEFQTDNRFVAAYEELDQGFQGFIKTSTLMTATTTTGSPAAGTFYSTILNRASIIDLSQDLKSRMGIDEIIFQQIYQLQNEFGANGEPVWSVPNDVFGQVRFVGNGWTSVTDTNGPRTSTTAGSTSDYVEIVFYGTGLNVLVNFGSSTKNAVASVDSETFGSNLFPATQSTILSGRNYPANHKVFVYSGLSLGVHTVKIRQNSGTDTFTIYGVEVLNESSSVKVNPGISYVKGQKYTSSSQSAFSYSSPVTGTRGGRVLVYQNSDGSIGQAFQAVNASQANLASADHTNEEIARTYYAREFGAGRNAAAGTPDDFSLESGTARTRAFTLDDGVTNLLGQNSFVTTTGGKEAAGITNSGSNFLIFTFVGCGLDIEAVGTGGGTFSSVVIDGAASVGSISPTTSYATFPVVSGLPYGTHNIQFVASGIAASISKFIVYQPKKPTLPTGSIELSDYNVMADFVANATSGQRTLATGVLRKSSSREFTYSGTWTANVAATEPSGWSFASSTTGDFIQYTFFGTGLDFRFNINGVSSTWQFNIDGATNFTASNSSPVGGVGWPGALTTSSYGASVTSFTSSTGTLVTSTTGTPGNGVRISGLSLGTHTVKITKTAGTGSLSFELIDLITPINSYKSNLLGDLQNTLSAGSQGISDNRKITPVKDAIPSTKSWAQATGVTTNPTTTSSSLIPMPEVSLTIKTNGAPIEVSYSAEMSNSTTGTMSVGVYVDGVAVGAQRRFTSSAAGFLETLSDSMIIPVSAGVHKVDLYWASSTGTGTAANVNRGIKAKEI